MFSRPIAFCLALLAATATVASDDIVNFRQYSEHFASAGQPSAEQLTQLRRKGYERVIYIAFSDHQNSLAAEDRLVKSLGMSYVHIPVVWNAPQKSDFELFAASVQQAPTQKTLLHCQVNFRASAFALLYRVIYEQVPLASAKADMNSVWTPDATWTAFIKSVLQAHNIDSECEGCDWTPGEF
ncbi:MAG: protein tyrosine phosphatase family protein [Pseudomonadales bacterium]